MFKTNNVLLLVAISLLFALSVTHAQFPRVCLTVNTLTKKECCPVPLGFKAKCGGPRRGSCRNIKAERWNKNFHFYEPIHETDDRVRWPTVFFNRSCHCKEKFDGFDCSRCAFGRHGKNCESFKTTVRRNIKHLSAKDALKYQKYLKLARRVRSTYQVANKNFKNMWDKQGTLKPSFVDVSVYDYYVWSHHYSARSAFELFDSELPSLSHNGQGFLTWHRHFVLAFERDLQELSGDRSFAIPYWDWTHSNSCDVCTEMYAGKTDINGDVIAAHIRNWYTACSGESSGESICNVNRIEETISRYPEETNQSLPVRSDVDDLMRFPVYDDWPYDMEAPCSFRNVLEGNLDTKTGMPTTEKLFLHNAVHGHFGGTMGNVFIATNDLVFLLHHCFVDRLLEKWLRRYGFGPSALTDKEAPLGHNRRSAIVPFFPVYTHEDMFKRSFALGYNYEDLDRHGYSATDGDQEPTTHRGCPRKLNDPV